MLAALVLGASAVGALVLPAEACRGRRDHAAWSTVLGLGVLAHLCFWLGLAGMLARGPLLVAAGALATVAARRARSFVSPTKRAHVAGRRRRAAARHPATALPWLATSAAIVALALYPPSAFDETLYHLPYARAFARTGGLPFLPSLRFPIFPQLAEALGAGLLLLASDVATHHVAVASTLLTAALLRLAGGARAGALAAAAFLGNPLVVYLAGTGYVEPFLALFATAAFLAAARARGASSRAWIVTAGFCAGTAAATKYLGLVFVGAAAIAVVGPMPRGRRAGALLLYATVAIAVAAPTYARIVAWTGNPVFPLLPSIFGASPWASFEQLANPLQRLVGLPRALLDLTLHRALVGRLPPLTPFYLAASPLLAWAAWRDARVRRPLALALGYAALVPPRAHYLLPALPFVSVAAGATLARVGSPAVSRDPARARRVVAGACAALLLPGWLYAAHLALQRGPIPTDVTAREQWLADHVPAYSAVAFLNRHADDASIAYAFGAEHLAYHFRGTLLGDWSGPYSYATVGAAGSDAERLHATLRELGATHLLLSLDQPVFHLRDDAETARWFTRRFADRQAEVYELGASR